MRRRAGREGWGWSLVADCREDSLAGAQGPRQDVRVTRRALVLVCVCFASFMVAMEQTVVATAMPSIVGELGGFSLYSWVFSGFLLTQAATTVIFGKLSDLYGRRPIMVAGVLTFLASSALAGLARSMEALIVFRVIQGVGAGAIMPMVLTIIGDLYPGAERASIQGYTASVWGVSAVLGPLVGGLIVEHFSWPWVFWVNIPIAIGVTLGLFGFLHERVERKAHRIDSAGAVLFTLAITALLVFLTEAGHGGRGLFWAAGALVLFAVVAPLLVWQERRAAEPMLALELWSRPLIMTSNVTMLIASMAQMGVTTCVPLYVQLVMGRSATEAGLAMSLIVLGWPVGATLSWKLFRAIGMKRTSQIGSIMLLLGAGAFLFLAPGRTLLIAVAGSISIGFGMGLLNAACINLIQFSVPWAERGAATASNVFARTVGAMLGAALLSAVLAIALKVLGAQAHIDYDQFRVLLDHGRDAAGESVAGPARTVLGRSLMATFAGVALLGLASALLSWRIPVFDPEELRRRP